jgi:citrate synthase
VIGRAVEDAISDGRPKRIPMNIDGVTAIIYSELGLTPELGRGVFILSRSVGILAHAHEQIQQGGRIKGPMPKSLGYTYAGPPRRSVPIERED